MQGILIHNPGAGDAGHPSREELLALLRRAGHDAVYQSSKEDGWEAVLAEPGDFVAVAGGDGTVGKVGKHLTGQRVPIAVLPLGTANNISTTLGLTDTPLEQLIAGWGAARRASFDVGVVDGPSGSSCFLESFGIGLFAAMMSGLEARDNAEIEHLDPEDQVRAVLHLLEARLQSWPAQEFTATLDGQDVSGAYLLLEAMNIRHVGPSLQLAPEADPGDGLLDVVLLSEGERDRLGEYLSSRLAGSLQPPRLNVRRGRHLQLACEQFDLHLDDEPWRGSDADRPAVIDVRVERGALAFLVPAQGQNTGAR